MKSKAPLMLMEQMIMLLVFALAAALCLQAFVKSEQLSSRSENRDRLMANGVPTDVPGLWKALVQVVYYPDNTNPDTLFEIEVSWQEVESNG